MHHCVWDPGVDLSKPHKRALAIPTPQCGPYNFHLSTVELSGLLQQHGLVAEIAGQEEVFIGG